MFVLFCLSVFTVPEQGKSTLSREINRKGLQSMVEMNVEYPVLIQRTNVDPLTLSENKFDRFTDRFSVPRRGFFVSFLLTTLLFYRVRDGVRDTIFYKPLIVCTFQFSFIISLIHKNRYLNPDMNPTESSRDCKTVKYLTRRWCTRYKEVKGSVGL